MATIKTNHPIVGIFLNKAAVNKLLKKQLPIDSVRYEKANREASLTLYYFTVEDINLKKEMIYGTFYDYCQGKWTKQWFSYPNIIYRRYKPSAKQRALVDTFDQQLRRRDTKPLNYSTGFNKWDVYTKLFQNQDLLPHLPNTILYSSPQDLEEMVSKYGKVYLKACKGGRGKQVMCIAKLPQGGYSCSYFVHQLYSYKFKNLTKLMDKVLEFYKKSPFIIQEAIDLITVNTCLVDMRPEVQRNGQGEIILAALPIRIGNRNAPITTHASSYAFEYFFNKFMDYPEEQILDLKSRITVFLHTLYTAIEDVYGPCGEIGIDIGLDKNDKLWFIECNSRSKKVSFFNAYDEETIHKSYLRLLDYARFLYNN